MNNNKKNNKKHIGAFVFLLLVAVAFAVGYGTYAVYQSTAQGSDVAVAAKWKVKVNGANIVNQDKFSLKGQNIGFGIPVPVQVLIDATDSQSNVAYKITKGMFNSSGAYENNSTTTYSYVAMNSNDQLAPFTDTIEGIHFYTYDETNSSCNTAENYGVYGNVVKGQTQVRTFCVMIGDASDSSSTYDWQSTEQHNSGENLPEIDNIESLPLVVIARQSSDDTPNNTGIVEQH